MGEIAARELNEANRKIADARRQLEIHEQRANEARAQLRKYEAFVEVWRELHPQEAQPEVSLDESELSRLVEGKTIGDAAEIVIRDAGGILSAKQITPILVGAGVVKDTQWAYNTVHKTLTRDGRFRSLRRGVWTLIELQPPLATH